MFLGLQVKHLCRASRSRASVALLHYSAGHLLQPVADALPCAGATSSYSERCVVLMHHFIHRSTHAAGT